MDIYKDFVHRIRKKELEEVYIIITGDIAQKLKEYVLLLSKVPYEDTKSNIYYGEMKRIISSFVTFFSSNVDETIKAADNYTNVIDKTILLSLLESTISIHQANQAEFRNEFLPLKTALEEQIYKGVEEEHDAYMGKLNELKESIGKFDKQEYAEALAKEHCGRAIIKTNQIFNFTHVYLGMMLADALPKIRTSVVEIYKRMYNNLQDIKEECEAGVSSLLNKLYDKNKDQLVVTRSERKNSVELAEVTRGIQKLRNKIENFEAKVPLARLEQEVVYWSNRVKEFNEVADNLTKLKAAQDEVIKEENNYNSLECKELTQKREHLTQLIIEGAKTLITYFAVRGSDRIFYTDNVGPYYVDEFNHQVYVFDHGLAIYHVNCDGDFKAFPDEPYYFDKFGRYIKEDGEKVYQCAPCSSHYHVGHYNLLRKVTKDCGHSEKEKKRCRMLIKDPTKVEILPDYDPIDISETQDSETVRYLWDSFGSLLPEALYDVGMVRPRNPIHFLAHKLIHHKYRRTAAELQQKKKEAEQYRADVYKKRKDEATAASTKWKSKQMKRRKPEESDDAEVRATYNAQLAEQMFINSLNYFNF